MRKTSRVLIVSWLVFSLFCFGFGLDSSLYSNLHSDKTDESSDKTDELSENIRLLVRVLGFIHVYYIDEVKLRDIVYPAIKEMVNQLDPYSRFLTPEEYKKVTERREKDIYLEYAGVGMSLGFSQNWRVLKELIESNGFDINEVFMEIKKVFDGAPAQKAGLMARDEVVAIDGILIKEIAIAEIAKATKAEAKIGTKLREVVNRIRGPAETPVILTIKRQGWIEPKDFTIIREKIQIKNVEWKIISTNNRKIGYLQLHSFSAESIVDEIKKAMKDFNDNMVSGLIIDLRVNPGGLLSVCVDALENFLPPNTLVISAKGREMERECYTGNDYTDYFSLPLVVLVNEGSASASEIFAGALRDYKKAILIGEKTYGKGSIQIEQGFPDGSALILTIEKYFLPNGECIHEKGISPDIEIETDLDKLIIDKALEVLKNWERYEEKFLKEQL